MGCAASDRRPLRLGEASSPSPRGCRSRAGCSAWRRRARSRPPPPPRGGPDVLFVLEPGVPQVRVEVDERGQQPAARPVDDPGLLGARRPRRLRVPSDLGDPSAFDHDVDDVVEVSRRIDGACVADDVEIGRGAHAGAALHRREGAGNAGERIAKAPVLGGKKIGYRRRISLAGSGVEVRLARQPGPVRFRSGDVGCCRNFTSSRSLARSRCSTDAPRTPPGRGLPGRSRYPGRTELERLVDAPDAPRGGPGFDSSRTT